MEFLTDIETVHVSDGHSIVEALTSDGGVCQASFVGPYAKQRAERYAAILGFGSFSSVANSVVEGE